MEQSVWENIFNKLSSYYYTNILWLACAVFAFIIGLKYYRKERCYQLFIVYIILNILINPIIFATVNSFLKIKINNSQIFLEIENTIYGFIELTAFFCFFNLLADSSLIKKIIRIFWILFTAFCIISIWRFVSINLNRYEVIRTSYFINSIEFIFLLILCINFFYKLLTKEISNRIEIVSSPSIWIVTGLFIYSVVSLPFFLIIETLLKTNNYSLFYLTGSIHYLVISFLLLCLAKAFSCKTVLTT